MHLRSLTLKGFKSFPDRTRLDFTPGVSVVVGPNGSGKSNITDAVLWALGEQSPLAVRGQSMQDVIFAGARGVQARPEAHVEVVLDNSDGTVDLPAAEISISRRLDRNGEGEYRLNGARCRLADVMEVLSDTGLGREMHSVVSQGRVEAIVTSKPRDRRMLIEEAAGLGKHRRRRRRAQLKLDRTQENLDRALDVEREARTRLRPLKRQAEAAELHARLERQHDEARWMLARDALRTALAALEQAERHAAEVREQAEATERQAAEVAGRRAAAERALTSRAAQRDELSNRAYAARSAGERVGMRLESARRAHEGLEARARRRADSLSGLEREAAADVVDAEAGERVAALEAELAGLARDRAVRLAEEVAALEARRDELAAETAGRDAEASAAAAAAAAAQRECDRLRTLRREAEAAVDRARRESARIGAELASANHFLRLQAGAPGGSRALSDSLSVTTGYELALAAALGSSSRSAVAGDLGEGVGLLERTGADGGSALVVPAGPVRVADPAPAAPAAGAERLADRVGASADPDVQALVDALLADVWVVEDLEALDESFAGVAVTRDGRSWNPAGRELRRVPAGGVDRVLTERNRRDELVGAMDEAAKAEQAARARVESAQSELAAAEAGRDELEAVARAAGRARAEAAEAQAQAQAAIQRRRSQPDDGPDAGRRRQLEAALAAERKLAERSARERADRERRMASERSRLERERTLVPRVSRLVAALEQARAAVAARAESLQAELRAERETGERLAAELSACAGEETRVGAALKRAREQVTQSEVRAQQARDRAQESREDLQELAARLELDAAPAAEPLAESERAELDQRLERLRRRREQLGPVNPLAAQEYAEALEHVEELERQRRDLEDALRELQGLLRDTDKRIREAFDETFQAAARNFEEVASQLFPGGRGRLRLVAEDAGPRPVLGGADAQPADGTQASPEGGSEEPAEDSAEEDAIPGVEIEITPAGKATRRLSLLSGGEKSMTALAFLFSVFLARPCPFYILDEVEAALDDANIDRFLGLLRRVSDRAQFVVVTHQRRTMEAADCLYGVSMAGNGVSKVISRRLPRGDEATGPATPGAAAA